jgi:hypothetical protein
MHETRCCAGTYRRCLPSWHEHVRHRFRFLRRAQEHLIYATRNCDLSSRHCRNARRILCSRGLEIRTGERADTARLQPPRTHQQTVARGLSPCERKVSAAPKHRGLNRIPHRSSHAPGGMPRSLGSGPRTTHPVPRSFRTSASARERYSRSPADLFHIARSGCSA